MVAIGGNRFGDGLEIQLFGTRENRRVHGRSLGILHLPIDRNVAATDAGGIHVHVGLEVHVQYQSDALAGRDCGVARPGGRVELLAFHFGAGFRGSPSELVNQNRGGRITGVVVKILGHDDAMSIQDVPSRVNLRGDGRDPQPKFSHCFLILLDLGRVGRGGLVHQNQCALGSQDAF